MTKKNPTANERVLDFLSEEFVYKMMKKDTFVRKMMLKGGFGDWLLIITAKIDGEPKVAFIGGGSILSVARKLHEKFMKDELVWRDDKFAD